LQCYPSGSAKYKDSGEKIDLEKGKNKMILLHYKYTSPLMNHSLTLIFRDAKCPEPTVFVDKNEARGLKQEAKSK
jgi:hypothetical protein